MCEAIRRFQDVPGLWDAPETSAHDREEMVHMLIVRITIDIQTLQIPELIFP
jgi:hypothetical protein